MFAQTTHVVFQKYKSDKDDFTMSSYVYEPTYTAIEGLMSGFKGRDERIVAKAPTEQRSAVETLMNYQANANRTKRRRIVPTSRTSVRRHVSTPSTQSLAPKPHLRTDSQFDWEQESASIPPMEQVLEEQPMEIYDSSYDSSELDI